MKNNKNYTLGEIIFGTRDEYLKIQEKLTRLKNLCVIEDESVEDFYFVVDEKTTPIKLKCIIKENFHSFPKIKKFLINKFNKYYLISKSIAKVEKQEDGKINISNDYYSITIPDENLDEFNRIIGELSEIRLTKELIETYLSSRNKNNDKENRDNLCISYNAIDYFPNSDNNPIVHLAYNTKEDYIYASSYKKYGKIKTTDIKNLLNIEFNCENLAKHHQDIIDNNISLKKNLILNDTKLRTTKLRLDISESENNLVLTKRKFKK